MKVVGLVVARMGSTRVPGKSMMDLAGKPVVARVIELVKQVPGLDEVALATSTLAQDDGLVKVAKDCGVKALRGDPERVLDRVYEAARELEADVLVDVGGDSPLLDPAILGKALKRFREIPGCDYLNNYEPPTFPEGLDINILRMTALERAYREAFAPSQRVHPFSYLTRHPELFRIENYAFERDLSELHWSIDFPEDVEFVQAVYKKLHRDGKFIAMKDVLELIETDREVARLNQKVAKPKSLHAFWNSPGIMRDMHTDISALVEQGAQASKDGQFDQALACYQEIVAIGRELTRFAEHRKEKGKS